MSPLKASPLADEGGVCLMFGFFKGIAAGGGGGGGGPEVEALPLSGTLLYDSDSMSRYCVEGRSP